MTNAPPRTNVEREDLGQLGVVQEILALLNDPAASAKQLAPLIAKMPVLAARIDARFRLRSEELASSPRGLALIGNRALEALLFELLEDLTVLHSELDLAP